MNEIVMIEEIAEKMLKEASYLRNEYRDQTYGDTASNPDVATALENYAYQLEAAVDYMTLCDQDKE